MWNRDFISCTVCLKYGIRKTVFIFKLFTVTVKEIGCRLCRLIAREMLPVSGMVLFIVHLCWKRTIEISFLCAGRRALENLLSLGLCINWNTPRSRQCQRTEGSWPNRCFEIAATDYWNVCRKDCPARPQCNADLCVNCRKWESRLKVL